MKFINRTSYIFAILFTCVSFSKAMENENWEKLLTEDGLKKLESIPNVATKMELLRILAEELPHIADKIIIENRYEISKFENYCVGIPADKDVTVEDTLILEHRRLLSEAYYLEKFLNEAFEKYLAQFPFGTKKES